MVEGSVDRGWQLGWRETVLMEGAAWVKGRSIDGERQHGWREGAASVEGGSMCG